MDQERAAGGKYFLPMDIKTIHPVSNFMLLKRVTENKTGLVLPENAKTGDSNIAEVIAVGPGRYENGKLVPCCVAPGDVVMLHDFSAPLIPGPEKAFLLNENFIVAILK